MKLTSNEILAAAEYVRKNGIIDFENGLPKEYNIGKEIPANGGIGYKRLISTRGALKADIADINIF